MHVASCDILVTVELLVIRGLQQDSAHCSAHSVVISVDFIHIFCVAVIVFMFRQK